MLEEGAACPLGGSALVELVESWTYLSAKHDAFPAGTSGQILSACQLADWDGWATAAGAAAESAFISSSNAPAVLRIFFTKTSLRTDKIRIERQPTRRDQLRTKDHTCHLDHIRRCGFMSPGNVAHGTDTSAAALAAFANRAAIQRFQMRQRYLATRESFISRCVDLRGVFGVCKVVRVAAADACW